MVPAELKYTKDHEWVRAEESEATIGITDHAQSQLGDITFIELPQSDTQINQSDSIATVESVKAASDVYAPVSGIITAVNDVLLDAPEKMNESPYGDGWICRINISDLAEVEDLMTASEYESLIKEAS